MALRTRIRGVDSIAEDCGKLSGIGEALGIMGCGCLGIAGSDVLILVGSSESWLPRHCG